MTDYILSKLNNSIILASIAIDNFGLITATFHINKKECVTVSGVTKDELNASFDNYMENETFEAQKPEKITVEKKAKKASEPKKETVKAAEKPIEETIDGPGANENVNETPAEEPKQEVKKEVKEEKQPKKEPVKEIKKPVDDDDDFNW